MTSVSKASGKPGANDSTRTQVVSLGKANLLDYMIQMALPIALVRLLDTVEFGNYRMLWLVANAVIALGQLHMPQSLLYLLPRESPERAKLYINNTLLFLLGTGLLAASILGPWNIWLPGKLEHLSDNSYFLPLFVLVWLLASMVELLPNADQRIAWQSRTIIGLSLLRAITLVAVAVLTRDIEWVFVGLMVFAFAKLALLYYYIGKFHGTNLLKTDRALLWKQIVYATPFGLSGSLYTLRGQSDQWVVASLFATSAFASFSIAYVFSPLANIIRQSVNNAVLPKLSTAHASGQKEALLHLNIKANVASNFILFPMLVLFFMFAVQIVEIIYTASYSQAADVMRIYLLGMLAVSIEVNGLLRVFSQGRFSLTINFSLLIVSALVSYLGARTFGLWGGALGSVLTMYIGESLNLRRAASLMEVPARSIIAWKQLAVLLGSAVLAGVLSKGISMLPIFQQSLILQLLVGSVSMALGYLLILTMLGQGKLISGLFEEIVKRRSSV